MKDKILDVIMIVDDDDGFGDSTGHCPTCGEVFYFPLFYKGKWYPCRHCGQKIWVNKK